MSTSGFSKHGSWRWGLFLTVMVAAMCGVLLGDFLVNQPEASANKEVQQFGTYSPIERKSDGAYTQMMEIELAVTPGTLFSVQNTNGKINVGTWDKSSVWIHAEKRVTFRSGWLNFLGFGYDERDTANAKKELDRVEVAIDQSSDEFKIETVMPQYRDDVRWSVEYEILIPKQMNAAIKSSNGAIEAKEIVGTVSARSSNGKVTLHRIEGPVTAHTSNGMIECHDVVGPLTARTTNGKVEARRIGSVSELKSSNGKVELELLAAPNESETVLCETSNGSVEIRLPQDSSFHVDLDSSHGSIENDFPLALVADDRNNRLEGHVGTGGGLVRARTSTGSIELKMD